MKNNIIVTVYSILLMTIAVINAVYESPHTQGALAVIILVLIYQKMSLK